MSDSHNTACGCSQSGTCACSCSNDKNHSHEHGSQKQRIVRIVLSAAFITVAVLIEKRLDLSMWQLLLIYLVPYLIAGFGTLREAAEGIIRAELFNENFLMSIATIGALCIGFLPGAESEFPEAVFVMLFFQVGQLFESYAEGKSRNNISHLMQIRPDTANVVRDGQELTVFPSEVELGEIIIVKPGERIALDGVIVEGSSSLDTLALTGESIPREVEVGDEVFSGSVNLSAVIRLRTTKVFAESTVSKIIDLVQSAGDRKSRSESFISSFARVYTPIVVIAALLLAFIPPIFSFESYAQAFSTWLYRALLFLVVSCPCALVISVPLTFFGDIGGASRRGILIKGSAYMDTLASVDTVVFDKTGTLTHGEFEVEVVHPDKFSEKELLHLASHVEHYSTHPIGEALRAAFPEEATDGCKISEIEEKAGRGITALVEGSRVSVGNAKMMDELGVEWHQCSRPGTIVHVAVDGEYAGHIVINDKIKEDSKQAIAKLKKLGVTETIMLTGDREEVAKDVAQKLGLNTWKAELLPSDKLEYLEMLQEAKQSKNLKNKGVFGKQERLAFVGDGINDAPSLKRADVGIAMGALGSDAAIEAADVVLMDDKPTKIAEAIDIARRTIRIARENVYFAVGVKIAILLISAIGFGTMWLAAFADVGVTVLAVLNAGRSLIFSPNYT